MSNQNINRNPGIKWAIFNFKRAKGMDCFDYLNSLYYFTFLWQWICKKALWCMYPYSWIFPSLHACKCAFSWDTFPPFKYMYLMDDPMGQLFEKILCETLCEKTVWENVWTSCIQKENLKYGHVIFEPTTAQLRQRYFFQKNHRYNFHVSLDPFHFANFEKNWKSSSRVMTTPHFWAQND